MTFLTRYIAYLKDNPERYWFKRKLYGWGWTPATWQGWLVVLLFILFLLWNGLTLAPDPTLTHPKLLWFFIETILAVAALILICYQTGESLCWQWGMSKKAGKK